jgi:hypothetical protein
MEEEYNDLEDFEEQETIEINEVIDALFDEESTFPPRFLYRLSGLEGPDLEHFTKAWPDVAQTRRERMLEDLEVLGDRTTYLDFDEIFLLGLNETSAHARQLSIRGLWESENPTVARKLVDLMTLDPNMDVRAQAARGLGKFIYMGELQELNPALFTRITDELIQTWRKDTAEDLRRGALESLGFCSRAEVNELIETAYNQNREDWLISALIAIGRSANDQWLPQVVESLNHDSPEVRLEAAQAAGLLAGQSAATHLLHLIDDPEENVKQAAIWALSEIGGLDARAALEGLLKSATEDDEIEFLEDALENLDFTEMSISFDLFDLSEEDLDEMIEDDGGESEA